MKTSRQTPDLVKIGQKYPSVCVKLKYTL